jgi:Zn-dependent protease
MDQSLFINHVAQFFILIFAFLSAITVHEFSHAWVAYLLGDDTAKRFGRLTLNPFAHIDLFGFLFLLFFRIGWAKPVPMDARNFAYPRIFSVLAGLAGPFSNFIFALFLLYVTYYLPSSYLPITLAPAYTTFLKTTVWINVMLGVFNLLPLPPLDGSHIIAALLPQRLLPFYYLVSQFSIFILLFLFLFKETYLFLFNTTLAMEQLLQKLVI